MSIFANFPWFKPREPKPSPAVFKSSLSEIPLFSSLHPEEMRLIEDKVRRVEFKKGDFVYRINEPAEAFYIITVGRFSVLDQKGKILSVLCRGDYFGESSLLLGRAHSAAVQARNDGVVFKISKEDFLHLVNTIQSFSLHISRTLGHRLTKVWHEAETSESRIISVVEYRSEGKRNSFGWNLNALINRTSEKRAILVGIENESLGRFGKQMSEVIRLSELATSGVSLIEKGIRKHKSGVDFVRIGNHEGGAEYEKVLGMVLNFLIENYDFVFMDLPAEKLEISMKIMEQSDVVYVLVSEKEISSADFKIWVADLEASYGFNSNQVRIIVQEGKEEIDIGNTGLNVFHRLPLEGRPNEEEEIELDRLDTDFLSSRYGRAVGFLARELTGQSVGLALGGGAAYGLAHIGVLKVLEREKIPVDIIAGSSIGALLGGMWASGLSANELEEISLSLGGMASFFKLVGFGDFSSPHLGFFKGHQVGRFLRQHLKRTNFRGLRTPLKVIAANLFTGEEVILERGDLVDAIRASIAIPGIFRAVKYAEQFLIDGGVVDPLPVEVLRHYGARKVIAVNVLSSPEDHIRRKEHMEKRKSRMAEIDKQRSFINRLWTGFGQNVKKRYQPNIFNVLMNTIQFMEYEIAETSSGAADVLIHPVLYDSHWAEFHSAKKFIRRGEEMAVEKLAEIKRLVEESN